MQWGCGPGFDICLISPEPWCCLWIINKYCEKQFRSVNTSDPDTVWWYIALVTFLWGKVISNSCAFLLFETIWKGLDVGFFLIFKQNAEYELVVTSWRKIPCVKEYINFRCQVWRSAFSTKWKLEKPRFFFLSSSQWQTELKWRCHRTHHFISPSFV